MTTAFQSHPAMAGLGSGRCLRAREARRLGRVRLAVADRPGSLALVDWAASVIEPGSTIKTDGAPVLRRLADRGFVHHATPAYSAADQSSTASNNSTCPTTFEQQHLSYYLDEYTFRFNRRTARSRGLLFYRLLQQAVNTDPHPLHTLVRPGPGSWDDFT